ncbi:uncharacterized protein LOC121588587 isoform X3 [Anopheles merus]|uniref:uncharacterized protein LOC121588587 isoform X3 n=1 Tax=Anopheles merus TaxID=30066 RepID=UPI001BE4D151|nr:uncharacterized protein LOC121588587 isoform X3 [Anopheles merus]
MEHTHQLVKVTNFMLHLILLLPLQHTTSTSDSEGGNALPNNIGAIGGLVGKSSSDYTGPITAGATITGSGRERSHLKGTGGCNRVVFSSSRIRNGSIAPSHSKHSGLFPSSLCQLYEFVGDGAERVQIIFSEFRLPSTLGPTECGDTDILMVYYIVNGREELVETLCGDTLPKPILSDGSRLLLELRSSYNNTENKGFTGDFFFLTNFGIPNGFQPNQSECTFHYFRNVTSQGWIQSPNFPGAYPRLVLRVVYGFVPYRFAGTVYFWAKRSLVCELAQQIRCHLCVLRTGRVNGSCHLCRIPSLCSSWSIFGLTLYSETSSVTIYFTVGPTISSTCASRTSISKEYDPATRTQPAITWSFLILSRAIASTRCTVVAGAS